MLPQAATDMQPACTKRKLMSGMLHFHVQQAACRLQAVLLAGFRPTWLPSPRCAGRKGAPWPGPRRKVCT